MRNLCFALLVVLVALTRAEEQIQVFATSIESNESIMNASGDVLVLYKDYYLSAKSARYDRDAEVIELFDNVTVMKGATYHMLGRYARLDLTKNEREITPFYLLEKESRVWMSCESAVATERDIDLTSGMVSGCDPNDPIWKLYFSSSDYDTETKWLNIYNARIVIGEVPVFYLPYFGYSLDRTRRSGLLLPSLGLSDREGFYYEQPIYIAEQNWWDLELSPQVRTKRGEGLYGTLRFVDSQVSKGELVFGGFQEKREYVEEFALENSDHYGLNFNYENLNPLKQWFDVDSNGQSGAYFDLNWMNDIEYINLQHRDDTLNATSSQVFSRANLFYNKNQDYFGTYVKYYLDLTQESNDETIQNLPTLHYHRYLETWLEDHLFYNVDIKANNYYRKVGTTAREVEANIPVLLQGSFFDDYLDISLRSQLYGKYIDFDNTGGAYSSGRFGRSTNTVQVGTHLTKGYEAWTHTVDLDVLFVKNGAESRNGYFETYENNCTMYPDDDLCSYYNITDIEEATEIRFAQYLFDREGSQLLYHRLTQYIDSDDTLTELENEFEWNIMPALTFYSDTIYDHELDAVTKQATGLTYGGNALTFGASHYYEDKRRHSLEYNSDYLTAEVAYRYDEHYNYFAKYAYDMERSIKKNVQVGFLYSKRCWDFGLRYVELNRPILTDDPTQPASSIYDKYLYFTIILKPMGGSAIQYQLNDLLEGS